MKTRPMVMLALIWGLTTGAAAPVTMTPIKVADGVYMLEHSQGSGNSTVIFTNDGVVVLDFHIDNADQTLAFIRKTTDKKVKYLITSHSAGDHASGAWHFREDAPAWIATKNQVHDLQMQEREEFLERKKSNDPRYAAYQKGEPLTPTIGIDGPMTLYFGGLTFQITPEGRAHSTGDLTVYIPQKRVDAHGRSARHRDPPGPRRVRRRIFLQCSLAGSKCWIISWRAVSPSKPTFPAMAPCISAAASKTWKSKSATSSSCATKWARWFKPAKLWSRSKRNSKCRRSSPTTNDRNGCDSFTNCSIINSTKPAIEWANGSSIIGGENRMKISFNALLLALGLVRHGGGAERQADADRATGGLQ